MRRILFAFALVITLPLAADEARTKAIQAATQLVDEGKVDQAIAALKKLAAEDPSDSTAAYELGLAYGTKGDNQQCVAILQPLADSGRGSQLQILGMLGNCLDQLGRTGKAVEVYRRGLKLAPDDSGLLFNLAVTLLQSGKTDEGRELLKRDAEKNPAHASAHLVLGQVFESQKFIFPAVLSYMHFLAIEPTTQRSATAASHLQKLLGHGMEKTKGGANITIDSNPRMEEGDYSMMQMSLAIVAAGSITEESAKKSEFEKLQSQVSGVLAIYLEGHEDTHDDFTGRVQLSFFKAMESAKMTETFAGAAIVALRLPGTVEWTKAHEKDLDAYLAWVRPQVTKPAVVLPPKP
jgi:tetratricopeptide (TPR) repeat protein